MKITVKNDIRNLKGGTVYDLSDLSTLRFITVVGDNGSGKSTLFQALRGHQNDNKSQSLYESEFEKLAKNFDFEHDYEKIFFLDRVKDDGNNMNVAYDAVGYLNSGGFHAKSSSHGQSSMIYLEKFLSDIGPKIVEGKTLLVLDEIDSGFSISYMSKCFNLICTLMVKKKCDIIIITHNPFLIIDSQVVFDVSKNEMVTGEDFISEKTGFKIEKIIK